MNTALVPVPTASRSLPIYSLFDELRRAVLNGVAAENSKRNYALALDELSAFCVERRQPVSRALLLEFKAAMLERDLSASTINVKLSAMRNWWMRPSAPVSSARKRCRKSRIFPMSGSVAHA